MLFGPLADVARQLLLSNFALRFGSVEEDKIIRLSNIDAVISMSKHCVLSISPGSVERLALAQYAPIVILIDVDSRSRVRELRSKAGATTLSARKMLEQASKIKKHYSHLLSGEFLEQKFSKIEPKIYKNFKNFKFFNFLTHFP